MRRAETGLNSCSRRPRQSVPWLKASDNTDSWFSTADILIDSACAVMAQKLKVNQTFYLIAKAWYPDQLQARVEFSIGDINKMELMS